MVQDDGVIVTLIGVVHGAISSCDGSRYPSIFTRVNNPLILNWIYSTIGFIDTGKTFFFLNQIEVLFSNLFIKFQITVIVYHLNHVIGVRKLLMTSLMKTIVSKRLNQAAISRKGYATRKKDMFIVVDKIRHHLIKKCCLRKNLF